MILGSFTSKTGLKGCNHHHHVVLWTHAVMSPGHFLNFLLSPVLKEEVSSIQTEGDFVTLFLPFFSSSSNSFIENIYFDINDLYVIFDLILKVFIFTDFCCGFYGGVCAHCYTVSWQDVKRRQQPLFLKKTLQNKLAL